MSGTFTSWGALVQALQKEVAEATEEVVDDSLDDLYRNVDRFYSSSEGRYHRTGMLCHHRVTSAVAVLCLQVRSV